VSASIEVKERLDGDIDAVEETDERRDYSEA
jgi:hypothetical protein